MKDKNGWFEYICFVKPLSENTYADYKKWCDENIEPNEYNIMYILQGPSEVVTPASELRIQFKNQEDALAFKLRWL